MSNCSTSESTQSFQTKTASYSAVLDQLLAEPKHDPILGTAVTVTPVHCLYGLGIGGSGPA